MPGPLLLPLLESSGALTVAASRAVGKQAAARLFGKQTLRTTVAWLANRMKGKRLRDKLVNLIVGAIKATGTYVILEWFIDHAPWAQILGTNDQTVINSAKKKFADDVRAILRQDGSPESISEAERQALLEYLRKVEGEAARTTRTDIPSDDEYEDAVNRGLSVKDDQVDVDLSAVGAVGDTDDIAPAPWSAAMVKAFSFWGRVTRDPEELRQIIMGTQQLMNRPEEIARLYNARKVFTS